MVQLVKVKAPEGKEITRRRTRIFIPSTVFDNPALLENDPGYIGTLASLPEAEKQALLYGNWDSFSGQVFTEWRNDPNHYEDQRWTHVIEPFPIPEHWKIWRGYDFGFSKPFSVGWYAADERGRLYRIKELYGCTGTPNEGLRKDPMEQARMIREAEQNDPLLKGRVILGIADPAIFDESRGESIADMQERSPNFLHWMPGDHTRLAGKMQFHYRLAFGEDGRPMLQVFNTCKHFIRTIPNLVYDESNVEDIDTTQEDHIYDECRYVLMENPISAAKHPAAAHAGRPAGYGSEEGQDEVYEDMSETEKKAAGGDGGRGLWGQSPRPAGPCCRCTGRAGGIAGLRCRGQREPDRCTERRAAHRREGDQRGDGCAGEV